VPVLQDSSNGRCRAQSQGGSPASPPPWLNRVEFESSRLLQAQIMLLKGPNLVPFREAVSSALERRHAQVRKLWTEALEGVGIIAPGRE
jgi:hypothetical protein